MERLLVLEKDAAFVEQLVDKLRYRFLVIVCSDVSSVMGVLRTGTVSSVLLNAGPLPDGMEVLHMIRREVDAHIPVIVISDDVNAEKYADVARLGAFDLVPKNVVLHLLLEKISNALDRRRLEIGIKAMQHTFAEHRDRMVFASEVMKRVYFEIARLAHLDFDVLIEGETGVGKDLAAFEIHQQSPRKDKLFVPIAMKSLSETLIESELFGHEKGAFSGAERMKVGKLEAASGGTVYIPEVSSLTEAVQLKLLQFMQYKTISRVGQDARTPESKLDVRIIMATNESLEVQVEKGRMREDFYHRITGVTLHIPPLRERLDDLEPLAQYFLNKYAPDDGESEFTFDPNVLSCFRLHRWSGNVRELENWIKSALAYSSSHVLGVGDFPFLVPKTEAEDPCSICLSKKVAELGDLKSAQLHFKHAYVKEILKRTGNNIPKAASIAGMTPQGFRKILHTLGISF